MNRTLIIPLIGLAAWLAGCTTASTPVLPTTTAAPTLPPRAITATPTELPSPSATPTIEPSPTTTPIPAESLIVVGDVASCRSRGDELTAVVAAGLEGTIALVGDIAYDNGSAADFANCYEPSWGPFKDRIRPVPGNHEYHTANAEPYFNYFGAAAGDPGQGWYSYDLGAWHIIALNSNCTYVGGCDTGSPQVQWLQADLAAHPNQCTLAYWHAPLFSSGTHGPAPEMRPFWEVLYSAGVDVVLNGHDHTYERFAPQDPAGSSDAQRGIRQFVVGTGGNGRYNFGSPLPNSEVRENGAYGLLQLTLRDGGYDWQFVPANDVLFSDTGSGACHP